MVVIGALQLFPAHPVSLSDLMLNQKLNVVAESVSSGPTFRSSQTDSSWSSISEAPSKAYSNFTNHSNVASCYQDDNTLDQLMNNVSISVNDEDYNLNLEQL